ncbi:MAG: creatininase family protein [Armatimonadetes bacterium]|nr:creatininase family protein [Armatimonadota bacterium]
MPPTENAFRNVRYELMRGREATEAVARCPVGYLPVGCLERHGDHLPMGLDTLKAHRICCRAAWEMGGVVFPAHHYAGIHGMTPEQIRKHSGEWGNLYTDATAEAHLTDIVRQIALIGIRALVLYTGHYPQCQVDMAARVALCFENDACIRVIPFAEPMVLQGDHAGVSETSLMLYLEGSLVDMDAIRPINYQDHGWNETTDPARASSARGESEARSILAALRRELEPTGWLAPPG